MEIGLLVCRKRSLFESIRVQGRLTAVYFDEVASEETQEASHSREITEPTAIFREDLCTMIHQVIVQDMGTSRAHAPAKEGSGELGRLEGTAGQT